MIYLTQTDTTVGFLSSSKEELAKAKRRSTKQPHIICVDSFDKLKKLTRIPTKHKNLIRRSKKTTFVYPNNRAIRVVKDIKHSEFLKKFDFLYSTSANEHKKTYNLKYALDRSDIYIYTMDNFKEKKPSTIIKLTRVGKRSIRKL